MKSSSILLSACLCAGALGLSGCSGGREAPQEVRASAAEAVCAAHGAPKSLCFVCDASLRERGRLWCSEHARYEDRCWLCHPELRDAGRAYCEKHAMYDDECFLCRPELRKQATLLCLEHGVPESECGICHPELLAGKAPGEGLKVRLPSPGSADKAGIAVADPSAGTMPEGVECPAELTFDQNRFAEVVPIVGGVIGAVEVDLGSRVTRGALLARLTSTAMSEAEGTYLRASAEEELRRTELERERRLRAEQISPERDVQEAEAAHKAASAEVEQARHALAVLGLSEAQIASIEARDRAPGQVEVRAPFAGEIVGRAAVRGALAEEGRPLFTIADTSVVWAMLSIPESQLARVRVGQPVRLTLDALPGETIEGRLTWLAAEVDGHTRMARARAEVRNPDGRLKARMFARAFILTGASDAAVVVPRSAVQSVGPTRVVFVREADDLYEARAVTLGASHDGSVEILAGLRAHEPVVVRGMFALKSQLLISRLGAGCAD